MQLPPIAKLVSPVQKKFASEWPPPCYLWHPLFCAVALNFYFTARFDGDSKTLCFYVALCRAERRGRRRGAAGFLSDEICRIGDFTSALGILIVELKHVTLTLAISRWFGRLLSSILRKGEGEMKCCDFWCILWLPDDYASEHSSIILRFKISSKSQNAVFLLLLCKNFKISSAHILQK